MDGGYIFPLPLLPRSCVYIYDYPRSSAEKADPLRPSSIGLSADPIPT